MATSVNSRKFQSIYNALDACNYSLAVKLCAMKDVERWPLTKALKSFALSRLGQSDEALALAKEVASKTPTDEDTLRALERSFSSLDAPQEIMNAFEAASKAQPENLSLTTKVFVHAAGMGDFLKAQKTALRLYKLSGEKRHVMWAVTAILVQDQLGENQTMIAVAERMIQKVLGIDPSKDGTGMTNTPTLSGQEMEIYIMLLRSLGKLSDALALLKEYKEFSSNLKGSKTLENNISTDAKEDGMGISMQAEIVFELGDFTSASEVYRRLLSDHPDQQAHPKCRGPRLAELELMKVINTYLENLGSEITIDVSIISKSWNHTVSSDKDFILEFEEFAYRPAGALCHLILQYMNDFATKPSVFQDLKMYFDALTRRGTSLCGPLDDWHYMKLFRVLQKEWDALRKAKDWSLVSKEEGLPQDQQLIGKLVHNAEVRWYLKRSMVFESSAPDGVWPRDDVIIITEVKQLCELYFQTEAIGFKEQKGAKYETKQVDTLIVIVAEMLSESAAILFAVDWKIDWSIKQAFFIYCEVATILELALERQPFNFHLKVAAVEVYRILGSFNKSIELLKGLDIKNIQLDSLGWMIFPGCLRCGYFKEALNRTDEVMRLHLLCKQDVDRNVGTAFEWGNYMQVIDMTHFQEFIMGRSMQLALAKIECVGLELLLKHHSLHIATRYLQHLEMGMLAESIQLSDEELEHLSDNMDFSVASNFQLPQEATLEKKRRRERLRDEMDIKQRTWRFFRKALQGSKATEDLQALTSSIRAAYEKDTDKFAKENLMLLLYLAQALNVYNGGDDGDEDVHAHSMEKEHLTSMSLSKLLQNAQQYAEKISLRFAEAPHVTWDLCNSLIVRKGTESESSLPFLPQWLAGACKMMLDVGVAIGLALQALSPLVKSSGTTTITSSISKSDGRKKKSKGKRKGGSSIGKVPMQQQKSSGISDGGESRTTVAAVNGSSDPARDGNNKNPVAPPPTTVLIPSQALQSLGSTWMSVLMDLAATLKREIQGKEDARVTSIFHSSPFIHYAVALPHESSIECSQALDKVGEEVLQGQARGAEQLLDVVKAKLNVLQNMNAFEYVKADKSSVCVSIVDGGEGEEQL